MEKYFVVGEKFKAKLLWDEFNIKRTDTNSKNAILKVLKSNYEFKKEGHFITILAKKEKYEKPKHGNLGNTARQGFTSSLGVINIYANRILDLVEDEKLESKWISKSKLLGMIIDKDFYNPNITLRAGTYMHSALERLKKYNLIKIEDCRYVATVGQVKNDELNMKSLKGFKRTVSKETYNLYRMCRMIVFERDWFGFQTKGKCRFKNISDLIANGTKYEINEFNQEVIEYMRNIQVLKGLNETSINDKNEFVGLVWEEFIIDGVENIDSTPLKTLSDFKQIETNAILRANYLVWDSVDEEKSIFKQLRDSVVKFKKKEPCFGERILSYTFEENLEKVVDITSELIDELKSNNCNRDVKEVIDFEGNIFL
ncbi:hypothetical protein [Clostridium perfringens]|uniref:hypothetical protein n=1 Tax=Clostridium perfringens TaxID=1502 RepID=UPI001ABA2135|nr:hypothetical protein [Clostridium perfringens]MBO3339858.1 hypothetical protein [Clostridium perfringens]MDK0581881.1 hypothetical protein [Clostridium perfringens]MDK0842843.1 hypothetical protein [Clostridium perfringens]MDM0696513.1 hypothetical protein [Clostridium perfringens]MDM1008175.1 hypothetical protein [Clostridium perfringens]